MVIAQPRPHQQVPSRVLVLFLAMVVIFASIPRQLHFVLPIAPVPSSPLAQPAASSSQLRMPYSFMPSYSHTSETAPFHIQLPKGTAFFTRTGPMLVESSNKLHVQFVNAQPDVTINGADELPGKVNYYIGNDPTMWRANQPTYAALVYKQLYPGIDVRYDQQNGRLKSTFLLASNSDPARIRWRYDGAHSLRVEQTTGDLLITLPDGATELREHAPIAWQTIESQRIPVDVRYAIAADTSVGFAVGQYNPAQPLTIDPMLEWSTFFGGNGDDEANDIAVDSTGNIYLTGYTRSSDFPTPNQNQAPVSSRFLFASKIHSDGSLIYSTYIGGINDSRGNGISVDDRGIAYIVGDTSAPDFPTSINALQRVHGGDFDGVVVKLNAIGSLVYSSYLGGSKRDEAKDVAVDNNQQLYITGLTRTAPSEPTPFPLTSNGLQRTFGGGSCTGGCADAFITTIQLPDIGSPSLLYSSYLGGNSEDIGNSIVLDPSKNSYAIAGWTSSDNFPTLQAFQGNYGGGSCTGDVTNACADAFVARFRANDNTALYSTYIGGALRTMPIVLR